MILAVQGRGLALVVWCAAMVAGVPAAYAQPSFVPEGKAFGFNANLRPPEEPLGSVRTLEAAQAAEATHLRMVISWRAWERDTSVSRPVPESFSVPVGQPTGNHQTDRADGDYLSIVERGITPLITVQDAPAWASTFHTCLTNVVHALDWNRCPPDWNKKPLKLFPARDRFHVFHEFAAALARRYPEAIFEGTNEPDTQREIWPKFHPPVSVVADGQCALAFAIRFVDPSRTVLGAGMWRVEYLSEYLPTIAGRDCFDAFNLHQYAWLEVRTGQTSAANSHLNNVRNLLDAHAPGKRIWVTETGMSDTVSPYDDGSEQLGETLVARAYPDFIRWWYSQPEVDGVFIHSIREGSYGESGGALGFGLLTREFAVKEPGSGVLPRFCWIVLSAGNTYPGCEGLSLPGPPEPGPPTFYKQPEIPFSPDTSVGDDLNLLFLEEGSPTPEVNTLWYRCNGLGLGCVPVAFDISVYRLTADDRFKRFKVLVNVRNEHGTIRFETPPTPVVG